MRCSTQNLRDLSWPANRLEEAIEWLSRSSGLVPASRFTRNQPNRNSFNLDENNWPQAIDAAAAALGIEVEPVSCTYGKLDDFFQSAAPAIIQMPSGERDAPPVFLVLKKSGCTSTLLGPNLQTAKIPAQAIADAFREPVAGPYAASANSLLDLAKIPTERQSKVRRALVGSWLGGEILQVGWLVRPSPGSSLPIQIRHAQIAPEILKWLGTYALQNVLFLLAWWLIGRVVMEGQTDPAWVWAWALLLISVIPFQLTSTWIQNRFSESLGIIFKQRLLFGALRINPDDIRHMGTGQLLERVMEAESVETLGMSGGLSALISVFQLGIAAWVLSQSAGGWFSVAVLGLWLAATLIAGRINFTNGKHWTDTYRAMTNRMVEKMVGHRTRLAQEDPEHRHDEEDVELEHYQALSLAFSQTGMLLSAIQSSWLVAGLACFIPALTSSQGYRLPGLAIGLGGVLLAYQAFGVIQAGIQNAIMLLISWEQARPIFKASSSQETPPAVILAPNSLTTDGASGAVADPDRKTPLLTVHDLTYRFSPNRRPALENCRLEIFHGDHIILEGSSGGGKTTLGAILAGLRKPESGLLLLHGYDPQSLGESTWRKRVVMAPQFHENHIFNETFAFNLLMGRCWPPRPEDMREAEAICRELGLGDLLERMPSGWQQMVGENGWQLSHGERSRVFIARALLQQADLVIMDESFGALDPENLFLALECAQRRADTLLVIAHP